MLTNSRRLPPTYKQHRLSNIAISVIRAMGSNSSAASSPAVDTDTINICKINNPASHETSKDFDEVKSIICNNDVVLFTSPTCGYCNNALTMLGNAGVKFTNVIATPQQRSELAKLTGVSSVPNVWVKGKYVGGCNDGPRDWMGVKKILAKGKLQQMLNEQ